MNMRMLVSVLGVVDVRVAVHHAHPAAVVVIGDEMPGRHRLGRPHRIAQSQQKFTGAYFRNDSFLEHHDQGLFLWTMYDKDGRAFVKGSSFGRFGTDGRLVQATGFFEAPSNKT